MESRVATIREVVSSRAGLFFQSYRIAAVEQVTFPGDRSGNFSPLGGCERPAQFVGPYFRKSIDATVKFGMHSAVALGKLTTGMK